MITGRLNIFIAVAIFLIAISSLVFNYSLVYNNKKSHMEQDMRSYAKNRVSQVNSVLAEKSRVSDETLKTILRDYARYNDVPMFAAFINSNGQLICDNGLPINFPIARYFSKSSVLTNFGEDSENVFVTAEIKTPEPIILLCGFTKKSLSSSIFNETLYISLWVFSCLVGYIAFIILYGRSKIDKPLRYLFENNLRKFVSGILASNTDCEKLKSIEDMALPANLKNGILDTFGMLQRWSCYKIHFDEFLTMTVAESNKQQLANNLFLAVEADFFVKDMTIFEINHSLNRFEPISVSSCNQAEATYEELLSDPSFCLAYRTGSRVVVEELKKSSCATCKAGENETILCKPMMSSGKQTGVIKFTLDNEKIITNDTINGSLETKIRFLESYLKPYIDLTALTMSNINMLNAYKNQALTDALTNLYNRRYITEYLYSLLNIAKRKESPLSVFMIDIDNFKRFNDEYGHKVGDTVLKIVSKTIKESVREGDTVARYGGEEFIVVLPYSDTDAAYEVGERVRSAVEKIEWNESEVPNIPPVTISLGIAAYPLHGYSHYHLTNAADKALYKAKREGKNKVVVHDIKERQVGEAGLH